ncbi:MAG: hypothetical protein AAFY48_05145 [Bacteroidota bacterium]
MKKLSFILVLFISLYSCNEEVVSDIDLTPANAVQAEVQETDGEQKELLEKNLTLPVFTTFYRGRRTDGLYYNTSRNGRVYGPSTPFWNNGRTNNTPTSIRHGNNIFVYHRGRRTGDIFGQAINVNKIERNVGFDDNFMAIPDQNPGSGPSAVKFDGKVYMFYATGNRIAYWRSDSPFFSPREGVFVITTANFRGQSFGLPNADDSKELGLVVHQGRLYCFYVTDNDQLMYISTDTGNANDWDRPSAANFNRSKSGLSAVSVLDNEILVTFAGITTNRLYVIRATQTNATTGELSFGNANWINSNAYTRNVAGIATNDTYRVSIAARVAQTGAIRIWKTDIVNGQVQNNWTEGSISSGATSEGVSHLYLGF